MDRIESCADVRAALPLFVGGDLDPTPSEDVARHLEACRGCVAEFERARRARQALLEARVREEGPALWPAIREVLRAEGRFAAPRKRGPVTSPWRRVAALAATLLIAFGLWNVFAPGESRRGASTSPPAVGIDPGAGELAVESGSRGPRSARLSSAAFAPELPSVGATTECPGEAVRPAVLRAVPLHLASDQRLPGRRGPVWFFDPERLDPLPPQVLHPADGARPASIERRP